MPSQYSYVLQFVRTTAPQASVTLASPNANESSAIDVPRPKMSKVETPTSPATRTARAAFMLAARNDPKPAAAGPAAATAGARPILGVSQTTMCLATASWSSSTIVPMLPANETAVDRIVGPGAAPPPIAANAARPLVPPPPITLTALSE